MRPLALIFTGFSLLLFSPLSGQHKDFPRDTSFTLNNTAPKVYRQYPHARLVEANTPAGVLAQVNLVYARYGERELHLDLFSPNEKENALCPGVILIHGGGWRSGNRQMEWPMAQRLAAQGYVAATVEYRLSVEARYPAGVYDLKGAIRWMRANAARLRVDPNKIAGVRLFSRRRACGVPWCYGGREKV